MKNLFLIYILACMASLFLFVSCEQSELQTTTKPDTTLPVTTRSAIEDCEDCPIDYCCCEIELMFPNAFSQVIFCGAYLGTPGTSCGPYNPGSPCSTISGLSSSQSFSMSGDRHLFCAPIGGSFCIQNVSGFDIRIRFTCQYDETNPDEEIILIPDTQTACFNNDGDCELSSCP